MYFRPLCGTVGWVVFILFYSDVMVYNCVKFMALKFYFMYLHAHEILVWKSIFKTTKTLIVIAWNSTFKHFLLFNLINVTIYVYLNCVLTFKNFYWKNPIVWKKVVKNHVYLDTFIFMHVCMYYAFLASLKCCSKQSFTIILIAIFCTFIYSCLKLNY